MNKINLALGFHSHQPLANFENVINEAYVNAYFPFLENLEKHPKIKVTLHYSGSLLKWIENKKPEFFSIIKKLYERKQIEIISSGFYEPILTIIPEIDAINQILIFSKYIEEKFGCVPKGAWLTERVWEPNLPKILSLAKIKYTLLDDTHFKYAGIDKNEITGYYITEKEGYSIFIFPISKKLRYLIPFRQVEEVINYLKTLKDEYNNELITYFDDGEKFGVWPGTYKWVYEEKWLEKFFNELEKNLDWINLYTFSEWIEISPPNCLIYIPPASYEEMLFWCLSPKEQMKYENAIKEIKEEYKVFLRGGYFTNFFHKYPELNHMHKRMIEVSKKINSYPECEIKKIAQEELYKSQESCGYWHGIFGGAYLNYLRGGIYTHLIRAENIIDSQIYKNKKWLTCEIKDIDKDSYEEVIVSSSLFNVIIKPTYGAAVVEIDEKKNFTNITNTLSRKFELYHKKLKEQVQASTHPLSIHELSISKEKGLENYLFYDRYLKYSFLDHFFESDINIDKFRKCDYKEIGDFANKPYVLDKKNEDIDKLELHFSRTGNLKEIIPVSISKIYIIDDDVTVKYIIKTEENIIFGSELNITLEDKYENIEVFPSKNEFEIINERLNAKLIFTISPQAEIWKFPIETVSQSEAGFERTYQCSSILFLFRFTAKDNKEIKICMKLH